VQQRWKQDSPVTRSWIAERPLARLRTGRTADITSKRMVKTIRYSATRHTTINSRRVVATPVLMCLSQHPNSGTVVPARRPCCKNTEIGSQREKDKYNSKRYEVAFHDLFTCKKSKCPSFDQSHDCPNILSINLIPTHHRLSCGIPTRGE
jgi:hypothetical protein